jgi:Mrp family chromosome partitioning ATPase
MLVVRHGKTTTDQVSVAVERLEAVGASPVGVIFNMTPAKGGDGYGYGYGYGYAPIETPEPLAQKKRGRRTNTV